jgi:hypothetical protein
MRGNSLNRNIYVLCSRQLIILLLILGGMCYEPARTGGTLNIRMLIGESEKAIHDATVSYGTVVSIFLGVGFAHDHTYSQSAYLVSCVRHRRRKSPLGANRARGDHPVVKRSCLNDYENVKTDSDIHTHTRVCHRNSSHSLKKSTSLDVLLNNPFWFLDCPPVANRNRVIWNMARCPQRAVPSLPTPLPLSVGTFLA